MSDTSPHLDWILGGEVLFVRQQDGSILAIEITSPTTPYEPRTCVMLWHGEDLMFDGVLQRSESMMGFIGIFDAIMEVSHGIASVVHFPAES